MDSMTPEEQEGVKMMQALLSLNNQWEPEEQSLDGWRAMSAEDKQATRDAYQLFCVGGHA